ncbi:MAG: family 43 glycosylhydrolase [Eubacterium sp.]|nr:family 43 glycosylhydrolase [Eubacterium sp.]
MRIKKLLAGILALSLALPMLPLSTGVGKEAEAATNVTEIELEKSTGQNPIAGFDASGKLTYGGDPSILVDGDTVYLYVGHDVSTDSAYKIPEYLCYSTKDLKTWNYEGVVMSMKDVKWGDVNSAWAGQVMKHNNKYYLYFCSWASTDSGKQSIGVAVADKPTGPFVDMGKPLVKGSTTTDESSAWNDIDPTAWIETDAKGVEHRYLAWGNGKLFVCELNDDMVSVKDINGDGKVTFGREKDGKSSKNADIIEKSFTGLAFTEAPWIYRRKDANGKYYGNYYLFYAYGFREQMAYATTDNLLDGKLTAGKVLMKPTATSDTDHMAVFDFKGKTYFVYHNGMLPGGSGHRRVASITELKFNADGSIQEIPETTAGISGKKSVIYTNSGAKLGHENYDNAGSNGYYPYKEVKVAPGLGKDAADFQWVLTAGKADAKKGSYVSIQSENKPGLYLTANSTAKKLTLAQDDTGAATVAKQQTFRTVQGLSDVKGVSFESVAYPGYFMTIVNGALKLTKGADKVAATFYMNIDANDSSLRSIAATVKKGQFLQGSKLNTKNVKVTAFYANGKTKKITNFTSNAKKISTKKTGEKTITVTYKEGSVTKSTTVPVTVVVKPTRVKNFKVKTSVTKSKVTLKMTWKKAKGQRYEISYGKTKKKHSKLGTKKITVKKATYKKSLKKMKRGQTYYVSIRSYSSVNGAKKYSKSTTVKVKIK